jgi:hypothetical protein
VILEYCVASIIDLEVVEDVPDDIKWFVAMEQGEK